MEELVDYKLIIRQKNSSESGDKRTRIFTEIRHTSESINCVAGIYLQGEKAETVTGGYSINYFRLTASESIDLAIVVDEFILSSTAPG